MLFRNFTGQLDLVKPENGVSGPEKTTSSPQIIFADNQGSIKLSKNPQHHNRTKHIDVRFHFIRESTQNGLIKLVYLPTGEMVADLLTKPLPRERHEKHINSMGLQSKL